ncbi:spore cortex biosynthesis protein YabQ [Solibacillus silvestris]|uniref:spore cortex biosynthesis protein YabQ n=1 Tax=Solibacillus silvestris TaxID=76853 RepID=UPI003F7FE971
MMMSAQLVSILVMFISGIAVGAIIDCIRINVNRIPFKFIRRVTWFFEWVVWLFLGVSTFYLLFLVKGGQWRFVDPLAQIAGIAIYELVFQNSMRFIGRISINIFVKPFFFIGHVLVKIVKIIVKLLIAPIVFISNPIIKIFKKYSLKAFKTK